MANNFEEEDYLNVNNIVQRYGDIKNINHPGWKVAKELGKDIALLHEASLKGNKDVVRYLLEKGVNPNATNFYGYAPIFEAAGNGNLEVVKQLVEAGAKVDSLVKGKESPLLYAILEDKPDVVKYLLLKGADLNYDVINFIENDVYDENESTELLKDVLRGKARKALFNLRGKTMKRTYNLSTSLGNSENYKNYNFVQEYLKATSKGGRRKRNTRNALRKRKQTHKSK